MTWRPTHRHYKGGLYRRREIRDADNWDGPPVTEIGGWTIYENEAGELVRRSVPDFEDTLPDGRRRFEPLAPDAPECLTGDERAARSVIRALVAELEKYRHCRHAVVDCGCTKEARHAIALVETAGFTGRDS